MADVDVDDGAELDARTRRARRSTLVNALWKMTEIIGSMNCVDAETASNWISAHFTIYRYYVLYDFLVYGYVGASFGGKPIGYTLVLILSVQMYVVMKIYHLLRR